jgi:IclR family transcriptional regulator, KDG regulon repressor
MGTWYHRIEFAWKYCLRWLAVDNNSYKPKYPVQSLEKALEIIEYLKESPGEGLRINDLSEKLGIGKSTVHRILDTLLAYQFVEKSPRSRYRLSWKLFEIGNTIPRQRNLDNFDPKALQDLCSAYGETVNLAIRIHNKAVIISKFDPPNVAVKANLLVGNQEPLHATAIGKALICEMSKEELLKILGGEELEQYARNTITSLDQLYEHLQGVREAGYSVDEEELSEGLTCIGVPIRNHQNEIIAAISISGPTFRLQHNKIISIIEGLKAVRDDISEYFGLCPAPL